MYFWFSVWLLVGSLFLVLAAILFFEPLAETLTENPDLAPERVIGTINFLQNMIVAIGVLFFVATGNFFIARRYATRYAIA